MWTSVFMFRVAADSIVVSYNYAATGMHYLVKCCCLANWELTIKDCKI
jgi:hypothetical protein